MSSCQLVTAFPTMLLHRKRRAFFARGAMKSSPLDDMVNTWNIAGIIDHQLKESKLFNCFFLVQVKKNINAAEQTKHPFFGRIGDMFPL